MHSVVVVAIENVHHEQLVGQQHHLLLGLDALVIFHCALHEHTAVRAVGVTPWRCWAHDLDDFFCSDCAVTCQLDLDLFLFHLNRQLAP